MRVLQQEQPVLFETRMRWACDAKRKEQMTQGKREAEEGENKLGTKCEKEMVDHSVGKGSNWRGLVKRRRTQGGPDQPVLPWQLLSTTKFLVQKQIVDPVHWMRSQVYLSAHNNFRSKMASNPFTEGVEKLGSIIQRGEAEST